MSYELHSLLKCDIIKGSGVLVYLRWDYMFRLKRVCAILCSGICFLGDTSIATMGEQNERRNFTKFAVVNPRKKIEKVENSDDNIKEVIEYYVNKFLNKSKKMTNEEEAKLVNFVEWLRNFWNHYKTLLFFGSCLGNVRYSMKNGGKVSLLEDKNVIDKFKNLDADYFMKMSNLKRTQSNWAYASSWGAPVIFWIIIGKIRKECKKSIEDGVLEWIKNVKNDSDAEQKLAGWYSECTGKSRLPDDNNLICRKLLTARYRLFKSNKFKDILDMKVGDSTSLREIVSWWSGELFYKTIRYLVGWCGVGGFLNALSANLEGKRDMACAIAGEIEIINMATKRVKTSAQEKNATTLRLTKKTYES